MARRPTDKCCELMEIPPLALYVHIPWCIRKCPYCDFNSHQLKGELQETLYIEALILDLQRSLTPEIRDRELVSIFIGGGTPSLFSAAGIGNLLAQLREIARFTADAEITMEANPGSLEHDQFEKYLDAGINRLSLGIQSFDDGQLKNLGRIHDADTASSAIHAAKSAGFENFNLDIMYGLPGQSLEQAVESCDRAMEFQAAHLSFYELTIEPNTLFSRHPPELPDSDALLDMQVALIDRLEKNDYHRYEVSAFSRPGKQCQHNLNYWEFGDYLGIGAGAHSKITTGDHIFRSWKHKHPQTYISRVQDNQPVSNDSEVAADEILFEFMLNALRLKNGVSHSTLTSRTGIELASATKALQGAIDRGWVSTSRDRLGCTPEGFNFIDEILQDLLQPQTAGKFESPLDDPEKPVTAQAPSVVY